MRTSNMDRVEELESVEKGGSDSPSSSAENDVDKKMERKILWKLDTRCVLRIYFNKPLARPWGKELD